MNQPASPIWRRLRDELRAHPYRTLAIAAAVGCVLGTRRGASVMLPLAARLAMSLASTAIAPLLADLEERSSS